MKKIKKEQKIDDSNEQPKLKKSFIFYLIAFIYGI